MQGCWALAVDWAALGSMLTGIGSIGGACAVTAAAVIGRNTFDQWRRQKQEERRMAVAEQLLVIAYKLKRAFGAIRAPWMGRNEYDAAEAKLRELNLINDALPAGAIDMLRTAQGALTRISLHDPEFTELMDMMPVAKALFGATIEDAMQVFWQQRALIQVAANQYADIGRRRATSEVEVEKALQRRTKYEARLWEGLDEDGVDEVESALQAAIATMESKLLPIIGDA